MCGMPAVCNKAPRPCDGAKHDTHRMAFCTMGTQHGGPTEKIFSRGHTFLLVAVDKFTKWIEAKPVTNAGATTALNFVKSIVFRFGVPHSIITDNGSNFIADEVQTYCEQQGIKLNYASVAHPQTNGQVERANGLVSSGLKK